MILENDCEVATYSHGTFHHAMGLDNLAIGINGLGSSSSPEWSIIESNVQHECANPRVVLITRKATCRKCFDFCFFS